MDLESKNSKIKQSLIETLYKRMHQQCKVYQLKVCLNRTGKEKQRKLNKLFLEAKWRYNDILAYSKVESNKVKNYISVKGEAIKHYDKDRNALYDIPEVLTIAQSQSIQAKIMSSIKSITTNYKRGNIKYGDMKFKSEVNSVRVKGLNPIIYNKKTKKIDTHRIKLPKIGKVCVFGINQIIDINNLEIACYEIIRRSSDYYIKLTTFIDKENTKPIIDDDIIGVDMGIKDTLTLSDGTKHNVIVMETDKLKKIQRKMSRMKGSKKGESKSNNYNKMMLKLKKEYFHISNIKEDKSNKLVHELLKHSIVVIQDEQIAQWSKNRYGKKVQHSILGRLKSKLMQHDNVIVLNKFCPTTKLCTECGALNDMPLYKRTYKCGQCGMTEDRDIHAAKNMVWFYKNNIGVGRTKFTPVEIRANIDKALSAKQEDSTFKVELVHIGSM